MRFTRSLRVVGARAEGEVGSGKGHLGHVVHSGSEAVSSRASVAASWVLERIPSLR